MNGIFFAVGVGPGDPELLTIKAINTIKKSDIIVVPRSGAKKNIALEIVKDYVSEKKVIEVDMPMVKDLVVLEHHHNIATEKVRTFLDDKKIVSFLTLGDPTIYSTVMYIHKLLTGLNYKTKIVSGVTSFCAAAASLNTSLCERDESLHIIPATYSDVDKALSMDGCKVLMKSGKSIEKFKDKLGNYNAKIVERATMEDEKIYDCSKQIKETPGYFSIVVVPSGESRGG